MGYAITAEAGANIAFIKYWGNRIEGQNLPLNSSISMTLANCITRTTVELSESARADEIVLDGKPAEGKARARTTAFLESVRRLAARKEHALVSSESSFPTDCGIASSASGFAALALAAATAYGLDLQPRELSTIARLGSGSAARSVLGGFVELRHGADHEEAYAQQLAPHTAWLELRDLIVIVSKEEKEVSSAEGHRIAHSSEMLAARLAAVPERAERVRKAIEERSLALLGQAAEEDAFSMHAVMMTSKPHLLYWRSGTLEVIRLVWELRKQNIDSYFTIDAGPNVHVLTTERYLPEVERRVRASLGFRTICDHPGPGARIVERRPE